MLRVRLREELLTMVLTSGYEYGGQYKIHVARGLPKGVQLRAATVHEGELILVYDDGVTEYLDLEIAVRQERL